MKIVLRTVLVFCLGFIFFLSPQKSFAELNSSDLNQFLTSENISKEKLEDILYMYYHEDLLNFNTVTELNAVLGEKLTSETLQTIISDNEFTDEAELTQFLQNNYEVEEDSTIIETYIYKTALENALSYYTPITPESLQEWLISFDLTSEEVSALFAENNDSISNYRYIEDMQRVYFEYEFSKITPLTEETLQEWLDENGLIQEDVEALFVEYDDAITNYETIEDLDMAYFSYIIEKEMKEMLNKLGLTDEEFTALNNHFESLKLEEREEELTAKFEEFFSRFEDLNLDQIEDPKDLTDAQKTEISSIISDVLAIFDLKISFTLEIDGKTQDIQLEDLIFQDTIIGDYSLKSSLLDNFVLDTNSLENFSLADIFLPDFSFSINISKLDGTLLADLQITDEFISEYLPELKESIKQFLSSIPSLPTNGNTDSGNGTSEPKPTPPVITGGKLPNTSGNYLESLLFGLFLIGIGTMLLLKKRMA
ncbi:MAG: peptidase [Bacillales bacterium]|jgi:hypothetical protein|nr:peptidase [Bacillales bacterium]